MSRLDCIGITGYAQHGKDTIANLLVAEYGYTRIAFADALKSMALVLDPIIDYMADVRMAHYVETVGWEEAKKNPEVRRFLQVLGTEAVRGHLGADSWVNALDLAWGKLGSPRLVIPDVRFPNEAEYVKKRGTLWRVNRLNENGTGFNNGVGTDHPSEANVSSLPADREVTAANVRQLEDTVRHGMDRALAKGLA